MNLNELYSLSVEDIENDKWHDIDFPTNLVRRVYEIRRKKLKDFTADDFRIGIEQDVAIEVLVPLAIKMIEVNILEEALYYPGDLLNAILRAEKYWLANPNAKKSFVNLLSENRWKIEQSSELFGDVRNDLLLRVDNFCLR